MADPVVGIIEGFYGPPWSWDQRAATCAWADGHGLTHYLYAPKDDPWHRARWREPYPGAELDHLASLAAGPLTVGFAISPGLSMAPDDDADRRALGAKVEAALDAGVGLVCLALDDIPLAPGLGAAHAQLTAWLAEQVGDRAPVVLVPTDYTSVRPTPYLDDLAQGLPPEVLVAWTGSTVVCDAVTVDEVDGRAEALGRPPLLWDNHPVNDGLMVDRLFVSPLRGREPGIVPRLAGYLANPMPQALASRPAIASAAAWWRGDDPEDAWRREVDALDARVLAEACDGDVPGRLVDALLAAGDAWQAPAAALGAWFEEARSTSGGALAEEAAAWCEQLHAEAQVGRLALRTLQLARPVVVRRSASDDEDGAGEGGGGDGRRAVDRSETVVLVPALRAAVEHAMALLATWQVARRAAPVVLGPRASVRAVLSQHPSGEWRLHREALEEDRSPLDALVRHVLDVVAALDEVDEGEVLVDGVRVEPVVDEADPESARWELAGTGHGALHVRARGTTSEVGPGQAAPPPLPDRRLPEPTG